MRSIGTFILFMFTLALLTAGSAASQQANPPGSYQQTCSEVSVKKGNLYAKCQDEKGKSHSAKLSDYEKCTSEIENRNGKLECAHGEGHAAPGMPSGSYTETCNNAQMKGNTLHAVCRSNDGREMPTTLRDADRCSQGVVNLNGVLTCAVSDVLPPGSYLATCKDVRLQGTSLHASCKTNKDRWVSAELRDANRCPGDIANHDGTLRCVDIKHKK